MSEATSTREIYDALLERVYQSPRRILVTNLFSKPMKICLLDFIGANDYFITEEGFIWPRSKVYPNKFNILARGYLPLVMRDVYYPCPWYLLDCVYGLTWWPRDLLMGWAFTDVAESQAKVYISPCPSMWSVPMSEMKWDEIESLDSESGYRQLAEAMYK